MWRGLSGRCTATMTVMLGFIVHGLHDLWLQSLLQSIDLCPVRKNLSQLRLAPNRPCMSLVLYYSLYFQPPHNSVQIVISLKSPTDACVMQKEDILAIKGCLGLALTGVFKLELCVWGTRLMAAGLLWHVWCSNH